MESLMAMGPFQKDGRRGRGEGEASSLFRHLYIEPYANQRKTKTAPNPINTQMKTSGNLLVVPWAARCWFHILMKKTAAMMAGITISGYETVAPHTLPRIISTQPSSRNRW